MSKIIKILIMVLAMSAVFIVFKSSVLAPSRPTATGSPENSIEPSAEVKIPADWKSYRDELAGFELKYPSNWDYNVDQEHPGTRWLGHPANAPEPYWLSIRVFDNPKKLSSRQWVQEILDEDKKSAAERINYEREKELTIALLPAYELYGVMAYDRKDEQIYLARGDKLYYFNFPTGKENPNLANPVENNKKAWQIISSFKFLK